MLEGLRAGCRVQSTGRWAHAKVCRGRQRQPKVIQLEQYFDKVDSGTWVEISGIVRKLLPDDSEDSRHQRMIVRASGNRTLLIAHNANIAGRVPVGLGDRIRVRGIYEWNDLGGLIHWTHYDPHGVEEGGYIQFRSKTYS